jgi:hypothetical protein
MNAVLGYLATKPAWAVRLAIWVPLIGLWLAALVRAGEILRDEDIPLPSAVPVTLDLGLLERTP